LDYIEAKLTVELSLSDLAAVAGLSPYHFARCFRQDISGRVFHWNDEYKLIWR
jgi:AraC-like DNA-binding protein